jgi:hypothetical protein
MKTMIILAVLVAGLLVVTGAAFAAPSCISCSGYLACYDVTGNDLTNPANSFTQEWSVCFVSPVAAYVCNRSAGPTFLFPLSLFGDVLIPQAISWDAGTVGAYMKFHGIDWDVFNGFYFNQPDRILIHGVGKQQCTPIT